MLRGVNYPTPVVSGFSPTKNERILCMKKIFVIIFASVLIFAASVTAFAASPITAKGGSDSAEVKGTYVAGGTAETIYSVDVAWGSMEFTYTDASEGTWNPSNHKYDGGRAAAWSCSDGANKINVTNHSNAAVTVRFSYASESEYSEIIGSFSNEEANLASAVDTEPLNAPSDSVILNLNGVLSSEKTVSTKIGTVTVTLVNE